METDNILLLNHELKYKKLSDKISNLRHRGEVVPLDLVLQAVKLGRLVQIPDDELNALLFNSKTR